MDRYIKADTAIVRMSKIVKNDWLAHELKEAIKNISTEDVKPIIKGFWYALEKGDKGYSAGDFKCSICGEPNHTWLPKPNYCPNCGADMRGEAE